MNGIASQRDTAPMPAAAGPGRQVLRSTPRSGTASSGQLTEGAPTATLRNTATYPELTGWR